MEPAHDSIPHVKLRAERLSRDEQNSGLECERASPISGSYSRRVVLNPSGTTGSSHSPFSNPTDPPCTSLDTRRMDRGTSNTGGRKRTSASQMSVPVRESRAAEVVGGGYKPVKQPSDSPVLSRTLVDVREGAADSNVGIGPYKQDRRFHVRSGFGGEHQIITNASILSSSGLSNLPSTSGLQQPPTSTGYISESQKYANEEFPVALSPTSEMISRMFPSESQAIQNMVSSDEDHTLFLLDSGNVNRTLQASSEKPQPLAHFSTTGTGDTSSTSMISGGTIGTSRSGLKAGGTDNSPSEQGHVYSLLPMRSSSGFTVQSSQYPSQRMQPPQAPQWLDSMGVRGKLPSVDISQTSFGSYGLPLPIHAFENPSMKIANDFRRYSPAHNSTADSRVVSTLGNLQDIGEAYAAETSSRVSNSIQPIGVNAPSPYDIREETGNSVVDRRTPLAIEEYSTTSTERLPAIDLHGVEASSIMTLGQPPLVERRMVAPALLESFETLKTKKKKYCSEEGCEKLTRSRGKCKKHGGGKRCETPGCSRASQGGGLCIAHGGGRRCIRPQCPNAAQSHGLCIKHGGGKRCKYPGCEKSRQVGGLCRIHGGGVTCAYPNCMKVVQFGGFCVQHGGRRHCKAPGCKKTARAGGHCIEHGGNLKCKYEDCNKVQREQGYCSLHLTQLYRSQQGHAPSPGIRPLAQKPTQGA